MIHTYCLLGWCHRIGNGVVLEFCSSHLWHRVVQCWSNGPLMAVQCNGCGCHVSLWILLSVCAVVSARQFCDAGNCPLVGVVGVQFLMHFMACLLCCCCTCSVQEFVPADLVRHRGEAVRSSACVRCLISICCSLEYVRFMRLNYCLCLLCQSMFLGTAIGRPCSCYWARCVAWSLPPTHCPLLQVLSVILC